MSRDNQRWLDGEPVIAEKRLDSSEWKVTLKDGTKLDARVAQTQLNVLRSTLARSPGVVAQLLKMAEGIDLEVNDALQDFCNERGLRPSYKAVLLNSASVSDGEVTFNDPYMGSEKNASVAAHNRHVLEAVDEARGLGLRHELTTAIDRINRGRNEDQGPGR